MDFWLAESLILPEPAISYGRIPWNSKVYWISIAPKNLSASLDSHEKNPQKVNGVLSSDESEVYRTVSVFTKRGAMDIQGEVFLIGPL